MGQNICVSWRRCKCNVRRSVCPSSYVSQLFHHTELCWKVPERFVRGGSLLYRPLLAEVELDQTIFVRCRLFWPG